MDDMQPQNPTDNPAELVRTLAATLRFARWQGADLVDRAWARQPQVPQQPERSTQPLPQMPLPVAQKPLTSKEILARLVERATGCQRCPHAQSRTHIVFGQGNPEARLMVVGDVPGPQEDAAGLPFQGEAGALLDKMLAAIQLQRTDVWLTTIALCQPPQPGQLHPQAIAACSPYLRTQMEAIRPQAVLLMGEAAAQFLFKNPKPLDDLRGHWHKVLDRPTLATWSLPQLLADPAKKRQTWADLQLVQKQLARP